MRQLLHLPCLSNIQIMIPHRFEKFLEDLGFLVETGEISMARIDDAVEWILRVKFISGVFEHPFSDPSLLDIVGCKVSSIFYIYIYSVFSTIISYCVKLLCTNQFIQKPKLMENGG
jgi:beta-glucosidase-like glycosyl hydrolase